MNPTPHDASGASLGRFNRAADTASTEVIRTCLLYTSDAADE